MLTADPNSTTPTGGGGSDGPTGIAPDELPSEWRRRARRLRADGQRNAAKALERAADELYDALWYCITPTDLCWAGVEPEKIQKVMGLTSPTGTTVRSAGRRLEDS